MNRGFLVVEDAMRKHPNEHIQLPQRADYRSAGYDFFLPCMVVLEPGEQQLVWTDIKAYMLSDEVLELYPRSSLGVKKGIMLANTVGIIDSSFFENISNDGNIGICLKNTSSEAVVLEEGERVCQGIFKKYLVADNDTVLNSDRTGGFGSSGK